MATPEMAGANEGAICRTRSCHSFGRQVERTRNKHGLLQPPEHAEGAQWRPRQGVSCQRRPGADGANAQSCRRLPANPGPQAHGSRIRSNGVVDNKPVYYLVLGTRQTASTRAVLIGPRTDGAKCSFKIFNALKPVAAPASCGRFNNR